MKTKILTFISIIFITTISSLSNSNLTNSSKTLLSFSTLVKMLYEQNDEIAEFKEDLMLEEKSWNTTKGKLFPKLNVSYDNNNSRASDESEYDNAQNLNSKDLHFSHNANLTPSLTLQTLTGASIGAGVNFKYNFKENEVTQPVSLSFSVSQPITKGFLYNDTYIEYQNSFWKHELSKIKNDYNTGKVIQKNITLYRQCILDKMKVEIENANLEKSKSQLEVIKAKIKNGLANKKDLNEAMLKVEEEKISILESKNQYSDNIEKLANALNLENLDEYELLTSIDDLVDDNLSYEEMLQKLFTNNPDYLSAIKEKKYSKLKSKASKIKSLPSLSAKYSFDIKDMEKPDEFNHSLSISGSYSPFDHSARYEKSLSKTMFKRNSRRLKNMITLFKTKIKSYQLDMTKLKQKKDIINKKLSYAESAYNNELEKFERGLTSFNDLTDSQNKLYKSKIDVLESNKRLLDLIDTHQVFLNIYINKWRNECNN
jgi:outer membrane protein TolC